MENCLKGIDERAALGHRSWESLDCVVLSGGMGRPGLHPLHVLLQWHLNSAAILPSVLSLLSHQA